jgi:hypothetical protein
LGSLLENAPSVTKEEEREEKEGDEDEKKRDSGNII